MKQLLATVLYPISFLFTPNQVGHERLIFVDRSGKKTKAKMRMIFTQTFNQVKSFEPNQNILIYYLNKEMDNETIEMIGFDIFEKELDEEDANDKKKIEEINKKIEASKKAKANRLELSRKVAKKMMVIEDEE